MGKKRCGECELTTYTCDKCGKTSHPQGAQSWAELPPPYGSYNAAYPLMLCDTCHEELITIVWNFAGMERPPLR